jgi:hypothetical protein
VSFFRYLVGGLKNVSVTVLYKGAIMQENPASFGRHPTDTGHYLGYLPPFVVDDWYNDRHPGVYCFPRSESRHLFRDKLVSPSVFHLPLSTSSFFVDLTSSPVFSTLYNCPQMVRLAGISQLGFLVPPLSDYSSRNYRHLPYFPHSRWSHSWLVAILAEVVLAISGVPEGERNRVVLAMATHDIATPAGGDSVIRLGEAFDEELNYSSFMEETGLAKYWAKKFSFSLVEAQEWIVGRGEYGKLLDCLDKLSYTALDCYYLSLSSSGQVATYCAKHPLVMDVWQSLLINVDGNPVFSDSLALYRFAKLRALEHVDFLCNPACRLADLNITRQVKWLLSDGKISRTNLLDYDDAWLENVLLDDCGFQSCLERFDYAWFRRPLNSASAITSAEEVFYQEDVVAFKTCLDWLVCCDGQEMSLANALPAEQVVELSSMADSVAGHYDYYWQKK